MYHTRITEKDAGQRFDKYLHRILPRAGSGFLYKMLRKKNITLNDRKADGSERVAAGDKVTIYFSDETLAKFMGRKFSGGSKPMRVDSGTANGSKPMENKANRMAAHKAEHGEDYPAAYEKIQGVRILYENDHILLVDKPAGVLSQKAERTDFSLNEWLV